MLIFKKLGQVLNINQDWEKNRKQFEIVSSKKKKLSYSTRQVGTTEVETNTRFDIILFEISIGVLETILGNISRPERYEKCRIFVYICERTYMRTDQVSMEIIDTPRNRKVI